MELLVSEETDGQSGGWKEAKHSRSGKGGDGRGGRRQESRRSAEAAPSAIPVDVGDAGTWIEEDRVWELLEV
jgi:hypothetical protein